MSDAERSIAICITAFAKFDSLIKQAISECQVAKIRIAVQVAGGRVLNCQVSSTIDFKPDDDEPIASDSRIKWANKCFETFRLDIENAIKSRQDGWLRLAFALAYGRVLNANTNPSFDTKPA